MFDLSLAIGHQLLISVLFGVLVAELVLVRPGLNRGHILIGEEEMMILPVFLDQDEKRLNYTTKAVCNCLSHVDWKDETAPRPATFKNGWPSEIQERVLANWSAYGHRPVG
jgi:hypothetical protein